MTNIAIAGAAGRMGRTLIQACQQSPDLEVTHAFERAGSDCIGMDCGDLSGIGPIGVIIQDRVDTNAFDVMIDFTNPAATIQHVNECVSAGKSIVIGTTGLDDGDKAKLAGAAQKIPMVFAPNMSVGVNLTLKLLQLASATLGSEVDVEVVEAHHKHKVDAPSGTALKMGEVIAEGRGQILSEVGVYERYGQIGPRESGTIGFSTIRGGDIVGEHTVMFITEGERIEVTHKAVSRMNFASGAVRAANWLNGKSAGLYDMEDVLSLRDK